MNCISERKFKAKRASVFFEFDLSSYLALGETIESSPFPELTSKPPGLSFSSTSVSPDNLKVETLISGGEEYQDYWALMKYTSSTGQEDEVSMPIRVIST